MFLLRKTRTITDDRGVPFVISWVENTKDDSREYLVRRVLAEFGESSGRKAGSRVNTQAVIFVVGFMVLYLGTIIVFAATSVPRAMMPFLIPVPIVGGMFVYGLYKSRELRPMYQRAALISVEEGACGSCWYELRSLPTSEDGMLVCPECQAAWQASRVRASAKEGGASADPMPKRAATQQSEVETFARALMLDLPTPVKDERGRMYSLVRSRDLRLRAEASQGATRERDSWGGARVLRSGGLFRRIGGSVLVLFVGVIVLFGRAVSTPTLSQSLLDWLLWLCGIFFGGFITFRAIGLYFRSDGIGPVAGKALLLIRSLCPSCGSSLIGVEVDSEGHTVCTQCSAAWKLPTPSKSVRYSECPKCHVGLRNVYADEQGRVVCGACGHVMSDSGNPSA